MERLEVGYSIFLKFWKMEFANAKRQQSVKIMLYEKPFFSDSIDPPWINIDNLKALNKGGFWRKWMSCLKRKINIL